MVYFDCISRSCSSYGKISELDSRPLCDRISGNEYKPFDGRVIECHLMESHVSFEQVAVGFLSPLHYSTNWRTGIGSPVPIFKMLFYFIFPNNRDGPLRKWVFVERKFRFSADREGKSFGERKRMRLTLEEVDYFDYGVLENEISLQIYV